MQNSGHPENMDDFTFYLVGYELEEALGSWLVMRVESRQGQSTSCDVRGAAVDSGLHHSLALGP